MPLRFGYLFIKDIMNYYGDAFEAQAKAKKEKVKLTEEQKYIYSFFDEYPKNIATVLEETKMDYIKLLSVLLSLEKLGLLAEVFKNNYVKTT